jgi:hypothetical protein
MNSGNADGAGDGIVYSSLRGMVLVHWLGTRADVVELAAVEDEQGTPSMAGSTQVQ